MVYICYWLLSCRTGLRRWCEAFRPAGLKPCSYTKCLISGEDPHAVKGTLVASLTLMLVSNRTAHKTMSTTGQIHSLLSGDFLHVLLDSTSDFIFMKNRQGRYLAINAAAAAMGLWASPWRRSSAKTMPPSFRPRSLRPLPDRIGVFGQKGGPEALNKVGVCAAGSYISPPR
jgi:hypothetical protein